VVADDRPLESAEQAIAALRADLEDRYSTLLARAARLPTRLPTGTMLATLATAPLAGTVLLQGQTLQRADYPALWAWAQATAAGGFGPGDGATTFVVPDCRGKVLRGVAAAGETVGQQVGADTRALTIPNLPAHDHNVSTVSAGLHQHGGSTSSTGGHLGHSPFGNGSPLAAAGSDYGFAPWNHGGSNLGGHSHSVDIDDGGSHTHSVSESSVGSGTAVDMRQASVAVNYLIWT
jgi:microcystin-dependent protein